MTSKTYRSPEAFKQALEQHLRNASTSGAQFARRRQLLVFDRFLARVALAFGDAVTLKGGLVLELRLARARTTKDVDLRMTGRPDRLLPEIQAAGRRDLDDFMTFEVVPDAEHPDIRTEGMQYDGLRFRAECKLAGRLYGQPFGVDVAFGDPMFGQPEPIALDDVLGFAGIAPPEVRLYPIETHIAEKLHAYTMPRSRPNTRVKDLPDIGLLATIGALDAERLRSALDLTFAHRRTHPLPTAIPAPSDAWTRPYAAMAREDQLPWSTLAELTAAVRVFLDPVLTAHLNAMWRPDSWTWEVNR